MLHKFLSQSGQDRPNNRNRHRLRRKRPGLLLEALEDRFLPTLHLTILQQPSPSATAGVPFPTQPVVAEEDHSVFKI
ncbi:MAG TPA: hypothetical protein VKI17_04645 [Gemmataceae bacterium]|nr:hypothetical protein [Gemmataceae bacterium]